MTAFLSLIIILLVVFVAECMDAASIELVKNNRRSDMNRAIESVFAEYQRDLLEEYEIFALDMTYEQGEFGEEQMLRRLESFGAVGMEQKIQKLQLLTDQEAQGFEEAVLFYMEHKYGLSLFQGKLPQFHLCGEHESYEKKYQKEQNDSQNMLDETLKEHEAALPEKDNPVSIVNTLKSKSILDLVLPEGKSVSNKQIDLAETVSKRQRNKGTGTFEAVKTIDTGLARVMLTEYMMQHFSTAVSKEEGSVLGYEMEYIYAGKKSDRENLKKVVEKLLIVRFASNYMYLQTSATKKSEAEALAVTLCSLALIPEAEVVAKQAILAAWAYAESIVDIKSLLNQCKIPLQKDDRSWQLTLSGLLRFQETGELNAGLDDQRGLGYDEYLRMLLYTAKKTQMKYRALDLIELNLQKEKGAGYFKADACAQKVEVESDCIIRNKYHYRFRTYFGYQ